MFVSGFIGTAGTLPLKTESSSAIVPFFVQLKTGVSDQSVWSYKLGKITLQHCHCHSHISGHFAKLQWLTSAVNHTYTKGVYIAWIFFFIFERSNLALCLWAGFDEV